MDKEELKKKRQYDLENFYNRAEYDKIKINKRTITGATSNNRFNTVYGYNNYKDKDYIINAIDRMDLITMRAISDYYYRTSGIYSRLVKYMAFIYRYDWWVNPHVKEDVKNAAKNEKSIKDIMENFRESVYYIESINPKKIFGMIALSVMRYGCYYGYLSEFSNGKVGIQELEISYCRSRFFSDGKPVVEFNMKYFEDKFRDQEQRMRILNMYPDDFKKGYNLYLKNKLPGDFQGDASGWYVLSTDHAVKFNLNGDDFPCLLSVIPAILDLGRAKELDQELTEQQLVKLLIQKLPIDKNGDLVFDISEGKQMHKNAVKMLEDAVGVNVLTTFCEVGVEDVSSTITSSTTDELERVERAVYNEAGVSQMQFNTDGNLALEKSIANDEATMYNLLLQFEEFLNDIILKYNTKGKKQKVVYKAYILPTTIYNYKEVSKLYKEQTQMGYSKMLPQLALGQSQSSILENAYFENEVLDLNNVFIPPMLSSTMSIDALNQTSKSAGRESLPDDEKSEKTIQNQESLG